VTTIKLIISFLLLTLSINGFAGVKTFLDRQNIYEGDIVKLSFELDFETQSSPDFSALEKDFTIKSTIQGVRYENINGRSSRYNIWTLSLQAKQKGEFTIPAIYFDKQQSKVLNVSVKKAPPEQLQKVAEVVFVEAEINVADQSKVYVQQQVPLTVRLYSDHSIHEGDIHIGEIENGTLEQLTQDKQYSVTRNGKHFNVLERRYIVSSDKSGELTIPAPLFKGRQIQKNKNNRAQGRFGNDPFFGDSIFGRMFGVSTKPISARGKPINLTILPVPSEFKGGEWLPAEDIVIIDSWTNKQPNFKVGEPTVRTLTVQASGLLGTQTPELSFKAIPKIQRYKDKEQTKTQTDGLKVFGIRRQDITYIPSADGKATIPGFSIDWWNVTTGKKENFTLPPREINIEKGVGIVAAAPEKAGITQNTPKVQGVINNTDPLLEADYEEDSVSWLTLALGGLISLIILAVVIRMVRQKNINIKKPKLARKPKKSELLRKLQQSCEQNNNKQAVRDLIALAEQEWPEQKILSIGVIAAQINNAETLLDLDKSLYADQQSSWSGNALWDRVKLGLRQPESSQAKEKSVLATLYPS